MKKRKLLLLSFVSIATMILSMTSCGSGDGFVYVYDTTSLQIK